MASAQALAHAHGLTGSEAATTPFALRLFRARPQVEALTRPPQNLARKPARRRAKPFTYRLVRTESTAAAPESG
ncbi:hypothetical protein [Streptomyces goshikiensis]|uniref:hypothetical protein n=1 Tax=Streptomyces goshikiensis TaxID=1942 RepID=UPI00367CB39E